MLVPHHESSEVWACAVLACGVDLMHDAGPVIMLVEVTQLFAVGPNCHVNEDERWRLI